MLWGVERTTKLGRISLYVYSPLEHKLATPEFFEPKASFSIPEHLASPEFAPRWIIESADGWNEMNANRGVRHRGLES